MRNYEYIIAGFPVIALDFKEKQFDYAALEEQVRELCSEKDCKLIDWFDFGSTDEKLTSHFYYSIASSRSRFLKEYFAFDKKLREAKVSYLETGKCDELFAEAFAEKNLIEREKKIDMLKWQKICDIVLWDLFNIDVILAFLAKARIVERWSRLDQHTGEEMFKSLVQEVRGTFKGIKETTI